MPRQATRNDLLRRARRAIERDEHFIYDVAANCGQLVGNVRNTQWFLQEVALWLVEDTARYAKVIF